MFNKIFWKRHTETSSQNKEKTGFLSGLTKKVKNSRAAFAMLVTGVLSWCAAQQNTQELETQKIDQWDSYSQASKNTADINDIAGALNLSVQDNSTSLNQDDKIIKTTDESLENNDISPNDENKATKTSQQSKEIKNLIQDQQEAQMCETPKQDLEKQTMGSFYIVKDGDRIYSIARKYGLNPLKVIALNENRFPNINKLVPGDKVYLGDIIQWEDCIEVQNIIAEEKTSNISEISETNNKTQKTTLTPKEVNISHIAGNDKIVLSTKTEEKKEIPETPIVPKNQENINYTPAKKYIVEEWDSLDKIAKAKNISLGNLLEYNKFLAIRNKKPIIYPGYAIFLEQPSEWNQKDQELIARYKKYHAAIDYDRRLRQEYKEELLANRNPLARAKKEKTKKETVEIVLKEKTHVVKYGDTLSEIALAYSTTVYDIQKANNIADKDKNKLKLWQILKIPDIRTDLLSYQQSLKLSEEEKKKLFYRDIKSALTYNPLAMEKLIAFLQKNISDTASQDTLKQWVSSQTYLISLLYSLEDTKIRDDFANSIKHPETNSKEIVSILKDTTQDRTKCGRGTTIWIEAIDKNLEFPDWWMHANIFKGRLNQHQDFVAVRFNDVSELMPGAIIVHNPGYWKTKDRRTYGHVEIYVWTNISKNDNNTWVKHYSYHVYSSTYGHFYPYLWGSVNHEKNESGLTNIAYYPKVLFDPLYVSTNMTKTEYAQYLKDEESKQLLASTNTQEKWLSYSDTYHHDSSLDTAYTDNNLTNTTYVEYNTSPTLKKLEDTPVEEVCKTKEKVTNLVPSWSLARTNKYITAFLKTNQDEENMQYLLRQLPTDWLTAKQCLTNIAKHYQALARAESQIYKNDVNSQKRLANILPKFKAVKSLLEQEKISNSSVAPSPK